MTRLMVPEALANDIMFEALAVAKVRQLAAAQSMVAPDPTIEERLPPYRFEPARYIREQLGWEPWDGTEDEPGQIQVLAAYALALRQQIERRDFEAGLLRAADLTCWEPGQLIQNRIRVEAGHTVGKTRLASGVMNHFFDTCIPSIVYSFGPNEEQLKNTLWKDIRMTRIGRGLPGRIMELRLERESDHFVQAKVASAAEGRGTERVQGQHGPYIMLVIDEGEGVADFVWDAVDSMASGGVAIVLMLANPRTRTSRFHKAGQRPHTANFRISELWHPNVVQGRDVIPGAVRRDYVDTMIDTHATAVADASPDDLTFSVPWRPGIFKPDGEFMFRVLGIAPLNVADDTVVPIGRYEAACQRDPVSFRPDVARLGLDVALFGRDMGTLYLRHDGAVRRLEQFQQQDYYHQALKIKEHGRRLAKAGVTSLHIRVDAGGGFGRGVIDQILYDAEFAALFAELLLVEVHFGSPARDATSFANLVTEMYFAAGESLRGLGVVDAEPALEGDLCERTFDWKNVSGVAVKALEPKDQFRKRIRRSPDDGDGFVLAVAPDYLFWRDSGPTELRYERPYQISPY